MTVPLLIAFDFDHTVVDDNTDVVVARLVNDERALTEAKEIYKTQCWTMYMQRIFDLLREKDATRADIENAISSIPPVDGFPALLKDLHSRGVEIIIISDSNTFFINHWLRSQGLDGTIREVFTNPAHFDKTGLLKISMYHVQNWCDLSEKNMCKGYILENYIQKRLKEGVTFTRIAYVGDGRNDLCPVLRLSCVDLAFPRRDYTLVKLLCGNTIGTDRIPKAEIVPWSDGREIQKELAIRIPILDRGNDAKER